MLIKCIEEEIRGTKVNRPAVTKPCGEVFEININSIAINYVNNEMRFYQLCPNCGYMVEVPKEKLTLEQIAKIKENNEKKPKMYIDLYFKSENKAMENTEDLGFGRKKK